MVDVQRAFQPVKDTDLILRRASTAWEGTARLLEHQKDTRQLQSGTDRPHFRRDRSHLPR